MRCESVYSYRMQNILARIDDFANFVPVPDRQAKISKVRNAHSARVLPDAESTKVPVEREKASNAKAHKHTLHECI